MNQWHALTTWRSIRAWGLFPPLRESGKIEEQLQLQQENVIFKERHFFGGINLRHLHIYPDLKRLKSHRDVLHQVHVSDSIRRTERSYECVKRLGEDLRGIRNQPFWCLERNGEYLKPVPAGLVIQASPAWTHRPNCEQKTENCHQGSDSTILLLRTWERVPL